MRVRIKVRMGRRPSMVGKALWPTGRLDFLLGTDDVKSACAKKSWLDDASLPELLGSRLHMEDGFLVAKAVLRIAHSVLEVLFAPPLDKRCAS